MCWLNHALQHIVDPEHGALCACTANSGFINMNFHSCRCVCTCVPACVCALHLLHWRWHSFVTPPAEHLEGCQRDEWLPLYRLLLSASPPLPPSLFPMCPHAPFHLPSALLHHLHFLSLLLAHLISSPRLLSPLPSRHFASLCLCLSYPFSILNNHWPCVYYMEE